MVVEPPGIKEPLTLNANNISLTSFHGRILWNEEKKKGKN